MRILYGSHIVVEKKINFIFEYSVVLRDQFGSGTSNLVYLYTNQQNIVCFDLFIHIKKKKKFY